MGFTAVFPTGYNPMLHMYALAQLNTPFSKKKKQKQKQESPKM